MEATAPTTEALRWTKRVQIMHWVSSFLIVGMIAAGLYLEDGPLEGVEWLNMLQIHAIGGLTVLVLTLVRLMFRKADPKLEAPAGIEGLHLKLYNFIHVMMYVSLFVMIGSGVASVQLSNLADMIDAGQMMEFVGPELPFIVHGIMAKAFIALLLAHIGGALMHHFRTAPVMYRMGIGKPE